MQYSYAYTLLGSLFYVLQHALFYLRFGYVNTNVQWIDAALVLAGILATAFFLFVLNNTLHKGARIALWVVFVLLGIPLVVVGSIMGGLLGPAGIVLWGVLPLMLVLGLARGLSHAIWGDVVIRQK